MTPQTANQINKPQVGQVENYPTSQCLECGRLNDEIADLKAQLDAAQGQAAHLQDALECIERAVGFVPKDEPLSMWVERKMNELEAAQKANKVLVEALEKLSILGNEPLPGNSTGNRIAQQALAHAKQLGL